MSFLNKTIINLLNNKFLSLEFKLLIAFLWILENINIIKNNLQIVQCHNLMLYYREKYNSKILKISVYCIIFFSYIKINHYTNTIKNDDYYNVI